jgi:ABC-type multidrug transport system fused ATPase/permease subunit
VGYVRRFLFKGSLLDNILIASNKFSKADVDSILDLSGCRNLFGNDIENFFVEENGKNLSGGQKQAASIARCLLKKTDILLFDEPTTYLDTSITTLFLKIFKEVFHNQTRIIITHDISIAELADRVFILGDGTITETDKYRKFVFKRNTTTHSQ